MIFHLKSGCVDRLEEKMPYCPNHHCDRCSATPQSLAHLPSDERIFYVRMINGAQWNGEEFHLCNECIGWYVNQVQILDGPDDDEEDDDEDEDPSSSDDTDLENDIVCCDPE